MKKLYTIVIFLLIVTTLIAQSPASFKYQAVLRDARGNIKANTSTSIKIDILLGNATGTAVYTETHSVTTDGYGLINLEIGKGTVTLGTFSGINWGTSTYFVKVTVDGVEMGTGQLLSVPYALYATTAANGFSGSYIDLSNKPVLFNGTFAALTSKPTTVAGYGITDVISVSSIVAGITEASVNNWNTAYGWGNHAGLYRPVGYVPAWSELTSNPFSLASVANDQLIKYNSGSGKWENWTPNFLTPTGSAALLTNFPILNQNTTGNAATVTTNANLTGDVTSTGNTTIIANKQTMTATAPLSLTGSPSVIASGAVAISIAVATPSAAGSMSATDKTKLDGITTPAHTIGESYGGGIIFYLDASGKHGLITATTDQSTGIQWYNGSWTNTTAFASAVGAGDGNTSMIVFNQLAGAYAAKLCFDLILPGFNDWYLPSKYELDLMYKNVGQGDLLGLGNVGGFADTYYWSSTELYNYHAWVQNFANGGQTDEDKSVAHYLRAVRAF